MIPYLLVFSFIMCWILLEEKALNRNSFWMPLIVLALFAGIRSIGVGTDSGNYVRKFIGQFNTEYLEFGEGGEYGCRLLEDILSRLTSSYFWLFFITGLIFDTSYSYIVNVCRSTRMSSFLNPKASN